MAAVKEWTATEIEAIYEQISNWGRWGDDDEYGTLNLITPEKKAQAAALVKKGRVFSIGRDLSTEKSGNNPVPIVQTMAESTFAPDAHGASDTLLTHNHGPQTHVDPTSHMSYHHKVYPGKSFADVVSRDGISFGSMYTKRDGIFTRGVFLDVPKALGLDYLDPSHSITAGDLSAAEEVAGTQVTPGDAIVVHSGFRAYQAASGQDGQNPRPGLGPDAAVWIRERDVAVVSNECPEQLPSICPEVGLIWHIAGLVYIAVTFVESPATEVLKPVCEEEGRYEFLFMVAPQRFPRGTGNLVNPLVGF